VNQLKRALKILATCKPETLAEHTCFTVEACREAIETASRESIRAASRGPRAGNSGKIMAQFPIVNHL
jgi:hypothetical protein